MTPNKLVMLPFEGRSHWRRAKWKVGCDSLTLQDARIDAGNVAF